MRTSMRNPKHLGLLEPSEAELVAAARVLAERLTAEVDVFEDRYELPSDLLEDALRRGEIRETAEVVRWWIAYQTLRGLADEREARRK